MKKIRTVSLEARMYEFPPLWVCLGLSESIPGEVDIVRGEGICGNKNGKSCCTSEHDGFPKTAM